MSDDVTLDPETLERIWKRQRKFARWPESRPGRGWDISAAELAALLGAAERLPQVVAERDRLRVMAPIDLNCGCEGGGYFVAQECAEDACEHQRMCPMTRYCDCLHGIMLERDDLRHAAEAEAGALDEVQRINREKRKALEEERDRLRDGLSSTQEQLGKVRSSALEQIQVLKAERDRMEEVVWGTTQRANLAEAHAKKAEATLGRVREWAEQELRDLEWIAKDTGEPTDSAPAYAERHETCSKLLEVLNGE